MKRYTEIFMYACFLLTVILFAMNAMFSEALPNGFLVLNYRVLLLAGMGQFCVAFVSGRMQFAKKELFLACAMVVWFVVIETHFRLNHMTGAHLGPFFALHLVVLPFAALMQDGEKQHGLMMAAGVCLVATGIILVACVLLLLDCVPASLEQYIHWMDNRAVVFVQPNNSGTTLMIGMAFALGLCFRVRKIWAKILMVVFAMLSFAALSLTDSRTAIFIGAMIAGGVVFFAVLQSGEKRFIPAVVAAVVVTGVLVASSSAIFQWSFRLQTASETHNEAVYFEQTLAAPYQSGASMETATELSGNQHGRGSLDGLVKDMSSLNGRTQLWDSILRSIANDPTLLLWGTNDVGKLTPNGLNAHNGWLEVLGRLGLPGFILSVVITLIALWTALRTLFRRDTDIWQKTIALLTGALMGRALTESFLFLGFQYFLIVDMTFYICLGYLMQWNRPAKNE